jgi:hypothetical protein
MPRKVTLTTNIGTVDAGRLDLKETEAGKTVSVSDEAAAELVRRGWATEEQSEKSPRGKP